VSGPRPPDRSGTDFLGEVGLFDRMAEISARAGEALDRGDAVEILTLLEKRQALQTDAEQRLASLPSGGHGQTSSDSVEYPRAQLLKAMLRLREADKQLRVALRTEHERLGAELDRMDGEQAVRTAYGVSARDPHTIDLVR
jgi:hypothetical protein